MNERIKELLSQAGLDPVGIERMGVMPHTEKFAELIVKECAKKGFDVFDEEPDATGDAAKYYVRDRIKEHFGVEE